MRALALCACVALFVVHASRYLGHIVDDSYIYYRFAENFARSHGLVFNPDERVEGHSSTLWTLLLGLYGKLGLPIPAMARWSGIGVAALTLLCSWRLALRFGTPPGQALVVAALLAMSVPLAYWAASGMPEVLLALLLVISALAYLRELEQPARFPHSAFWLILVALTRPESFALPAVFVGHSLAHSWLHDRLRRHRRQILLRALIAGAGLAAFFAWRLHYYGWPLSNATYAKLGGEDGLASPYALAQYRAGLLYLRGFLLAHAPLALAGLACCAFLWPLRRHPLLSLALLLGGFQVLLILKGGGDWMPLWRFILPALPFALVLCARGAALIATRWPRLRALPVAGLVAAGGASLYLVDRQADPRLEAMNQAWSSAWETAHELRAIIPPGELIASCAMGVVPYALLDNPFVDMVGLCDVHIAHHGRRANPQLGAPDDYWEKADMDYVFERRRPQWVLVNRSLAGTDGEGGPRSTERVRGSDGRDWSVSRTSATNQLAATHPALARDYELVAEIQNRPLPGSPLERISRRMFVYRRR